MPRFLARKGEKEEAIDVLNRIDEFAVGRVPDRRAAQGDRGGQAGFAAGRRARRRRLGSAARPRHARSTAAAAKSFVRLYLQLARALEPNSDAVLLQLASVAEQQNDSEEAIDLYARIPADSPIKRVAELQRGLNLADLDRQDEAIAQLTKLLDQDPDDMRAYLALGGVYASKEDFRNAADVYDKAVGRLKMPDRRRLEHLLPARHRL